MAVSIIDGTIEEVELKRRRKLGSVYSRIMFRLPDGTTKTWGKSVVWNEVADRLKPGTKGRFYLYTAIDHRGIHGVRTADGGEVYGFGKVNEYASIGVLVLSALTVAFSIMAFQDAPLLATILLVLSVPMYLLYRNTRVQAERQFRADAGYRPPTAG
jgi:hypothetical protein